MSNEIFRMLQQVDDETLNDIRMMLVNAGRVTAMLMVVGGASRNAGFKNKLKDFRCIVELLPIRLGCYRTPKLRRSVLLVSK